MHKKESQDICFIPNGDYRKFIEQTGKLKASSGIFTDRRGNLLETRRILPVYDRAEKRSWNSGQGVLLCS